MSQFMNKKSFEEFVKEGFQKVLDEQPLIGTKSDGTKVEISMSMAIPVVITPVNYYPICAACKNKYDDDNVEMQWGCKARGRIPKAVRVALSYKCDYIELDKDDEYYDRVLAELNATEDSEIYRDMLVRRKEYERIIGPIGDLE